MFCKENFEIKGKFLHKSLQCHHDARHKTNLSWNIGVIIVGNSRFITRVVFEKSVVVEIIFVSRLEWCQNSHSNPVTKMDSTLTNVSITSSGYKIERTLMTSIATGWWRCCRDSNRSANVYLPMFFLPQQVGKKTWRGVVFQKNLLKLERVSSPSHSYFDDCKFGW